MSKFGVLKSMTGFGRASTSVPEGHFEIEIQGINRRHLELNFNLPKTMFRFENEMRKWAGLKAARGQINFNVVWRGSGHEKVHVTPDMALAKALTEGWKKIGKELQIDDAVTFSLLGEHNLFHVEKMQLEDEKVLLETFERAFIAFDETKRKEGEHLLKDFEERIVLLQEWIAKIEGKAKDAVSAMRNKLKERLDELFGQSIENEEKILREVALFAEKIDITEEIVRFKTHLGALIETLRRELTAFSDAKGKRIEFLLQECSREINTIGSKSNHAEIAALVIDCKCELERMRESVQNVE